MNNFVADDISGFGGEVMFVGEFGGIDLGGGGGIMIGDGTNDGTRLSDAPPH
jgi:hypothetical protein